jgi:hypothetical protein
MNSNTSTTWVQLASLLSRTPNCADIDSPEAQMRRQPVVRFQQKLEFRALQHLPQLGAAAQGGRRLHGATDR